jgi:hypothetical protein
MDMGSGARVLLRRLAPTLIFAAFFSAIDPSCAQSNSAAPSTREIAEFAELLKVYLQYPKYIPLLKSEEKVLLEQFKKYDTVTLKSLPAEAFRNLYQRFYVQFVGFDETKEKLLQQIVFLKDRKIALPLGEKKKIVELDLKIKASEDQVEQARFVLFSTSFGANKALMEMLSSASVKALAKKEADAKGESKNSITMADVKLKPKLPGAAQESKEQRASTAEADKLNLTPVDPEFYNTQLGKKLEKDLGGRANYWSYDFEQDELYVAVGDGIGKLRVKQKDQGTRIIQTRIGSGFQDFPADYEGDEAVDLNIAQGRFLTGNPADPTLFGNFPTTPVEYGIPEGPTHKRTKAEAPKHDHK